MYIAVPLIKVYRGNIYTVQYYIKVLYCTYCTIYIPPIHYHYILYYPRGVDQHSLFSAVPGGGMPAPPLCCQLIWVLFIVHLNYKMTLL
jgi:hypothetical protein